MIRGSDWHCRSTDTHESLHTHMRTRWDAHWGPHAGHRFRLDAADHWRVKSLHFKLTQMVMVYKECGWGEGVVGDRLGIVINLCLVWSKEISSHTNRQKPFLTPFEGSGDRCVRLIDGNVSHEELERRDRNALGQDRVGMKRSPLEILLKG